MALLKVTFDKGFISLSTLTVSIHFNKLDAVVKINKNDRVRPSAIVYVGVSVEQRLRQRFKNLNDGPTATQTRGAVSDPPLIRPSQLPF